jgi:hypothetical protein
VDEVAKIREAMAAAVRKFGSRPTLVAVAEDAAALGVTSEELAEFESSVREATTWIRSRELTGGNQPEVELMAIAAALGTVVAWDHGDVQLAILLAYRLITAAEQVKEQP